MSILKNLQALFTRRTLAPQETPLPADEPEPEAKRRVKFSTRKNQHGVSIETWNAMTTHQRKIISMVCKGLSNGEIAAELHISRETVKSHLWRLYKVLEVENRNELRTKVLKANIDLDNP